MSNSTIKPTASSERLKEQAKVALTQRNYPLAIELFSYALEQVPRYAPYLTNRALCYLRLDDADKVLRDAQASIQSDPNWTKGYFYKGKALEMLNRKKEAIECFRKCCELEPNQNEYQDVLKEAGGGTFIPPQRTIQGAQQSENQVARRTDTPVARRTESPITRRTDSPVARRSDNQVVHEDVVCDVCRRSPIVGVRYKCSVCDDYDICSDCLSSNPSQRGHKDTHPLTPIKQAKTSSPVIERRSETSVATRPTATSMTSNSESRAQVDVSVQIHCYNVILVVDVSLSMIGYEANGRINPAKNRWPATERGIIKIVNQLGLRDRFTCLAFNAKVYEFMDGESATAARLKLALVMHQLKPSMTDNNSGTALYDAIASAAAVLLRNKLAGLLSGDSNRNQIILITDGEDYDSTKCDLRQACSHMDTICDDFETDVLMIGIGLESQGRAAMNLLKRAGGERCKFVDLTSLSELDDIFDRISFVFTQRTAVINI